MTLKIILYRIKVIGYETLVVDTEIVPARHHPNSEEVGRK